MSRKEDSFIYSVQELIVEICKISVNRIDFLCFFVYSYSLVWTN